jgi:hypothetical protein
MMRRAFVAEALAKIKATVPSAIAALNRHLPISRTRSKKMLWLTA